MDPQSVQIFYYGCIAGIALALAITFLAALIVRRLIADAPAGYEDKHGFHVINGDDV